MENINNQLTKIGLKPLHPCSVLFYYIPMKGSISYTVLGMQMMCPELYENFKFLYIPRYISLTNACLVNSLVGSSLYLYSRPHLRKAPQKEHVTYCIFGAGMFNLGSMLLWALAKTVVPENVVLRLMIGFGGAVGALWVAQKYVDFVDSQVPEIKSRPSSKK